MRVCEGVYIASYVLLAPTDVSHEIKAVQCLRKGE